ncbi:flagellar assembly protein FliH [Pseudoalteromonas fenneropenaei]|uniref:Flagellar assembly protein FliH n=1 Tax=Pseudoalteromonas fenneropenaei TaxID=1737459 RepID=A0ABV7CGR6_9GAMM
MTDPKLYRGRPIHLDESVEELLKNWPIPDVAHDERKIRGRSTAMGTPLEELYRKKEAPQEVAETPEELDFPKLTLEELEQIREDAYQEGIKQGHEQGYIDGFDKGHGEGKEAGFREGLEIGRQQGLDEAKPLVEEKLTALSQIFDALHKPLEQVDEQAEKQLVQLAAMLAEAVLFRELALDPTLILQALKKAIDALPMNDAKVRIHLHPEDLALVKEGYGDEYLIAQGWQLLPEPTLQRGGCEVKTPQSSIDMTIKTRIKEILDTFLHDSGI